MIFQRKCDDINKKWLKTNLEKVKDMEQNGIAYEFSMDSQPMARIITSDILNNDVRRIGGEGAVEQVTDLFESNILFRLPILLHLIIEDSIKLFEGIFLCHTFLWGLTSISLCVGIFLCHTFLGGLPMLTMDSTSKCLIYFGTYICGVGR